MNFRCCSSLWQCYGRTCRSSLLAVQRAHVPVFLCAVLGWCWHCFHLCRVHAIGVRHSLNIFFFLKNSGSPKWNLRTEAAHQIFTVRPSPHCTWCSEVRGWIMLHWKYFVTFISETRISYPPCLFFAKKEKKNWDDSRLYTYVAGRREVVLSTRVRNIGKKGGRSRGARKPATWVALF